MKNPFQSLYSIFTIILFGIFVAVSGCENPGSVGSSLTDAEAEVTTDTLFIEDFTTVQPNSYSGEQSFFSAGYYNDPLFGSMETTAFLKPVLPGDTVSINEDARMLMRLMINENQVYGNVSADQEFSVYEIDELWRDKALMIDDEIKINTNQKVGEFVAGNEDSIDVELSADWVDKYRQYHNDDSDADSLYKYNFYGLAVVPDNQNKIIPLNSNSTQFVIQNPEADTFEVSLTEWGYNVKRSADNTIPEGSVPLYSTYESVLHFNDLGVSDLDVPASGFSRAELVIYQNNSEMEQSMQSEPTTAQRAGESNMYLHLADSTDIPESIDPGLSERRWQSVYSADEEAYRFDVTNLVDRIVQAGMPEGSEFFMTFPNDGVIKPSLIYMNSEDVPADKRPKIIITSLKNRSN